MMELTGQGLICFQDDSDWFQGHFISNSGHSFTLLFKKRPPPKDIEFHECCYPHGPPLFYDLQIGGGHLAAHEGVTIRQIERNVGDLVNLQASGFEFRGTAVKVEEQAQITRRKFFPKLQDSIHWIICFGDITWTPKKNKESGKEKEGEEEGDEQQQKAGGDEGDDTGAHNQPDDATAHPHPHPHPHPHQNQNHHHHHHHHGIGSGACGHQVQSTAHSAEDQGDEEEDGREEENEEGQEEENEEEDEDAEGMIQEENDDRPGGFEMLVTNGNAADDDDDDFQIRIGENRPLDSKRKKQKTSQQ